MGDGEWGMGDGERGKITLRNLFFLHPAFCSLKTPHSSFLIPHSLFTHSLFTVHNTQRHPTRGAHSALKSHFIGNQTKLKLESLDATHRPFSLTHLFLLAYRKLETRCLIQTNADRAPAPLREPLYRAFPVRDCLPHAPQGGAETISSVSYRTQKAGAQPPTELAMALPARPLPLR
jgi:hypothetical protein